MYKLEDMRFLNMETRTQHICNANKKGGDYKVFELEDQLTIEEKIQFIDELKDGVASYMLNIINKWEEEKEFLPKDQYKNVKTISHKAWINRNDNRNIMSRYDLGKYNIFRNEFKCLSLDCPTTKNGYNELYTGSHIVNQWFHDLLRQLKIEERKYFESIDPVSIKIDKVQEMARNNTLFGSITINDIVYNRKQDVSEKELDIYINAYEKLEEYIKNLSQDIENKVNELEE